RRGACEAVVFSENGMLAYDTLGVWSGVDHFEEVSTNYNILYASIFTQYVNSNDTIVQDLPSTVCRDIQIVNGGTGYVSRIEHRVTPGSDLNDYTLNYQGVSLSPVQISGGTLVYVFDLASPPFAGTFGAEDTILQNGEVLIFEECFTVTNCSFSDGDVDHQSFWGCGSAICQTGNMVQGSVGLNFSQPDIRHAIDSLDNIVCMDGQDRGFIRMRVWNVGAGPLVVDQITLSAGGNNTAIDMDDINVFTANGENIQSYFPVGEPSG